jgi:hypothetical protein
MFTFPRATELKVFGLEDPALEHFITGFSLNL